MMVCSFQIVLACVELTTNQPGYVYYRSHTHTHTHTHTHNVKITQYCNLNVKCLLQAHISSDFSPAYGKVLEAVNDL